MKLLHEIEGFYRVSRGSMGRNERTGRGGKSVRTGADRENHRNREKGFRDKWAGCVVKRLTARYGNGVQEGRAMQTGQGTANRR